MAQGKMTVEDDEIIQAMLDDGDPAYVTSEVAELVKLETETVRRRLDALAEEGRVVRKKPGSRTVLWWPRQHHAEPAFPA